MTKQRHHLRSSGCLRLTPVCFPFFRWLFFFCFCGSSRFQLLGGSSKTTTNAQPILHFGDLAPPSFHTGTVLHGFGGESNEDPSYRDYAMEQFTAMSVTSYLPYQVWNDPNMKPNLEPFARLVDLLRPVGCLIHGHVLVYPNANLDSEWWTTQPVELVEGRMLSFVEKMAGIRRGQVWTWDVVNEAIWDPWWEDFNDSDEDGVRMRFGGKTIPEYQAMGQDYIAKAFWAARRADPDAILLLVDYGIEEDFASSDNDKSDYLYRFVRKLQSQSVPIDGVGFQMHKSSQDGTRLDEDAIRRNFQRFRNLGLRLYVTEMDVTSLRSTDPDTELSPQDYARADGEQAAVYRAALQVCLQEPACEAAMFWDYAEYSSEKPHLTYSWLHPNRNGEYTFPTPFWDIAASSRSPKQAWGAMRNELSACATRIYRLFSLWESESSYLLRVGNTETPSSEVQLYTLDTTSAAWSSLKWTLEPVVSSAETTSSRRRRRAVRIRNQWEGRSGYLSRYSRNESGDGGPGSQVGLLPLHPRWTSQIWYLDHVDNDVYYLQNGWTNGDDDGYLTRLGETATQDDVSFQPTNMANLDEFAEWSSQKWVLRAVQGSNPNESVCQSRTAIALTYTDDLQEDVENATTFLSRKMRRKIGKKVQAVRRRLAAPTPKPSKLKKAVQKSQTLIAKRANDVGDASRWIEILEMIRDYSLV